MGQKTHRRQCQHAPHRNTDPGQIRTHPQHLLVKQRSRRSVGAAVFARQIRPPPGEVGEHPHRHVVDVEEPGLRRQCPAPSRVHRITRIDITGVIGVAQAVHQPIRSAGQVGRSDLPCHHPYCQHTESGGHPGPDQAVSAGTQADHRCLVETAGAFGEQSEVVAIARVGDPDSALRSGGHRSQRCR